jgi:hypothetical protein
MVHLMYINDRRGIVIMGVGPGGLSTDATNAANTLFEQQGIITVDSLRPAFGAVVPRPAQASSMVSNLASNSSLPSHLATILLEHESFSRVSSVKLSTTLPPRTTMAQTCNRQD